MLIAHANWTNVFADVSAVVVILGGVIAFIRWVAVPALVHHIRKVGIDVQGELRPNGGASFRDHFDKRFDAVQTHLRIQDNHLKSQDGRLDGIDDRLGGIDDRISHVEERIDERA